MADYDEEKDPLEVDAPETLDGFGVDDEEEELEEDDLEEELDPLADVKGPPDEELEDEEA